MYRYCSQCLSLAWRSDPRSSAQCGHQSGFTSLPSGAWVIRTGACLASSAVIMVRIQGSHDLLSSPVGKDVAIQTDLALESRIRTDGIVEVRFVGATKARIGRSPQDEDGWYPLFGASTFAVVVGEGHSRLDGKIDFVPNESLTPEIAGGAGLSDIVIGVWCGVGTLGKSDLTKVEPTDSRADIALLARDDDCVRLVSLNVQAVRVNGVRLVDCVVQRGDIVEINRVRWQWEGRSNGFRAAKTFNAFKIDLSALSLKGRVRDFTCSFQSGKLSTVLGGSGSGKTTLIRMIAGLLVPDGGEITTSDDPRWTDYESFAAKMMDRIAYIPQEDAVLRELTVRQCLEYAIVLHPSCTGSAREQRAIEFRTKSILETLGLSEHAHKPVDQLSGGQRRRVNLGVGLVGDPDVVVLDEPTTGLDFENETKVMALLARLAHQGRVVIVVTHSLAALNFADHCVVIRPTPDGAEIAGEFDSRRAIVDSRGDIEKFVANSRQRTIVESAQRSRNRTPKLRMFELLTRVAVQWLNTPKSAVLAFFILPFLLGLLVRIGSGNSLSDRLAIGLVAIFWLGINQSVRDILKDLEVIRREDVDGTHAYKQVLARVGFFMCVAVIQSVVMTLPFHWVSVDGAWMTLNPTGEFVFSVGGRDERVTLHWIASIIAFWVAGVMGSVTGLAVACACTFARKKAESIAVLVSVLVTLPQFLYSEKCLDRGLVDSDTHYDLFLEPWHTGSEWMPEFLSFFTVSRWTFLPLEAIRLRVEGTNVFWIAGFALGGAFCILVVLACGTLSASFEIERGGGWIPKPRRARSRSTARQQIVERSK